LTFEPIEFPVVGLVGDAIRLRLRSDADVPRIVAACQDPAIQRYTVVPANYERVHALEYGRVAATGMAEGTGLSLVIADVESDELLGTVALRAEPKDGGRWSVGYWVAAWARRRGVATSAVQLIAAYGFDELGAERIDLLAEPENVASVRVAEGSGFRRERLLPHGIVIKGTPRDVFMYTLLPPAKS
jgi:RimJ/RimL family protein N-acetyltransferase